MIQAIPVGSSNGYTLLDEFLTRFAFSTERRILSLLQMGVWSKHTLNALCNTDPDARLCWLEYQMLSTSGVNLSLFDIMDINIAFSKMYDEGAFL